MECISRLSYGYLLQLDNCQEFFNPFLGERFSIKIQTKHVADDDNIENVFIYLLLLDPQFATGFALQTRSHHNRYF